MIALEFGSTGAFDISVFHGLVGTKGRKPLRLAPTPRLITVHARFESRPLRTVSRGGLCRREGTAAPAAAWVCASEAIAPSKIRPQSRAEILGVIEDIRCLPILLISWLTATRKKDDKVSTSYMSLRLPRFTKRARQNSPISQLRWRL